MPTKLGQNFLTSESIAQKIAESSDIEGRNVLEIGPGKGMLTKYLAQSAGKLLAVEIDRGLAASLPAVIARIRLGGDEAISKYTRNTRLLRYARNDKVRIINDDILKINLPKLIEENDFQPYKVVANLPYYITSKIIRLFLETKYPPAEMVLMVQKEVGERIVGRDAKPRSETRSVSATGGKESILSISVKFYADPEIIFEVSRENFSPVPEVDSVVIKITRKKNIPDVAVKNFFSLIRAGFSSKRKMLANNLSAGFHIPKAQLSEVLKKAGLEPTIRAEKLETKDWLELYKVLNNK